MKYLFIFLVSFALSPLSLITKQNIELKGQVVDATSGEGVASAIVKVKNTSTATATKDDGSFTLIVPDDTVILEISAVGFETKEVRLKAGVVYLTIKLRQQAQHLDEVVVSGYTIPRQAPEKHLKGSVAGIAVQKGRHRRHLNAQRQFNTEDYDAIIENRFVEAVTTPLSTFSIDVDGASYSNVRRFLSQDQLPPAGSVRIEEMINYFRYDYPQPLTKHPFSINTEAAACPWNKDHQLVMIGLQARKIDVEKLPSSNLVFLIDVSGSMTDENKLPLVKTSLKLLTEQLREQDKVAIVVYAGSAGLVLPSTSGSNKQKIIDAIDELEAGGSTAGGAGIKLAYKVAQQNFVREGNNRVILCTDGDFNIGVSSDAELERLIEHERESGVFLTVLGYGMGNYKDNKMQKLADKGNGNHSYIDNLQEAKKVLVNEFGGTLFTVAKDVKLQVEFNPNVVQAYRLVGYENRLLNKEDFNNDKKDAGDIGSGHTVTAMYEIIPVGVKSKFIEPVDALKYQSGNYKPVKQSNEIMNVKIRYKQPDGNKSVLLEQPILASLSEKPSQNFMFAAAVAQYGMILNKSEFRQNSSFTSARKLASRALGYDSEGYRKEFLKLIDKAEELMEEDDVSLNK